MKKKLLILSVLIIVISISITSISLLMVNKSNYQKEMESKLAGYCKIINRYIEDELDKGVTLDYNKFVREFHKQIGGRITIIDKNGKVLGDSNVDPSQVAYMENHRYRQEVIQALEKGIGISMRHSSTLNIDFLYVAVPFEKAGQIEGVTRIAFEAKIIQLTNKYILETSVVSALAALILALILSIIYSGKIVTPIRNITKHAVKIAEGNYDDKIFIKTGDEIEVLGNTINIMGEKLKENIDALTDNNNKMLSILSSMKEAIIAVDMNYKIILVNKAAMDLFDIREDVMNEHLLKVVRNNRLHKVYKDIIEGQFIGEQEIEYTDNRLLKIHTDFIKSDRDDYRLGVFALIEDITQIKKLENIRKDFVANVSHELKTPLTSIGGFVETLQSGAAEKPEVRNKFLDIIAIETARLKRLIEDLLIISDIESGRTSRTNENIKVKDALTETVSLIEQLAEERKITIKMDFPAEDILIHGNLDRFKQMMLNLVENAVKYSNDNTSVNISVIPKFGKVYISVKDQGIGIPAEYIPRLFERFYRVDKSRSQKAGGTGLGLAIVKHIVNLFDGEIKVESKEGEGSTFTVILPVDGEQRTGNR